MTKRTNRIIIASLFTAIAAAACENMSGQPGHMGQVTVAGERGRTTQLFDLDWKFLYCGPIEGEAKAFNQPIPAPARAAFATPQSVATIAKNLDTSAWRTVDLPHDYAIEGHDEHNPLLPPAGGRGRGRGGAAPATEPAALPAPAEARMSGPFDRNSPAGGSGGFLNGGIAWYAKTFTPPADSAHKRVSIQFDGVYMDSTIFLNGEEVGVHPYGYTTFSFDLTDKLKFGQPNTIAVRTNVMQPSSRWYSGAGIYRHVWLITENTVHIGQWGTYITTPELTDAAGSVTIRNTIQNDTAADTPASVSTILIDPSGREVSRLTTDGTNVPAGKTADVTQTMHIANPQRWSTETPTLYKIVTEVRQAGALVDATTTPFGFRTIEFTAEDGFHLNGKRLQIYGVCDHHDLGALGSAALRRGIERQLQMLKAMGCNAIRTSHNPPSPDLLDLCDQLGFVVMDESFDEWLRSKTTFGYGRFFNEWSESDIKSMVRRDRNHPSVVMWSIGNEISEQGDANGGAMAKRLADFVKEEDPTRFTVSAMNNPTNAVRTGFADALDIFGINYHIQSYATERQRQESTGKLKAMIGSETSSTVSTRGEYNLVVSDGVVGPKQLLNTQVTSYDTYFPSWATTAEAEFGALHKNPFVAGEFVWTGFDYIGEPTPFPWPARSSYFGIIDLAGFPKDRFYLYQSEWTKKPMVHILPHWNWPQFAGKEIPVWAYSNADSVELIVNGKSVGEKKFDKPNVFHIEWKVPYVPGKLEAIARKAGQEVARDTVETTGDPAKLVLKPDRSALDNTGNDLSFIRVEVQDAQGRICPNADEEVKFTVAGPAYITGVDNGDATNLESFKGDEHKAFHGLALVIVRGKNQNGTVHVTAAAPGLMAASTELTIK